MNNPPELELTILMPCLNEAETLGICISKSLTFLADHQVAGEVLIADNGSSDGSREIAQKLGARVVEVAKKGYGAALLGGIEAARGRYIIMADSDDSYDLLALMPFLEKLRAGNALVMGNRFQGGIRPGAMPALHRYLGNPLLSGLGRLFFHIPVRDFHCGLRGFEREALIKLNLRTLGMEFASEMVIKAHNQGLTICEVPTILYKDGRSRPPHLRSWRDGWRHLRYMLLFSPRWLFLIPGLLMMAVGCTVGLWLWLAPQHVGRIILDTNTLLYAAITVLIGYQAVLFALLTKIYGINQHLLPEDNRLSSLFKYFTLETGLLSGAVLLILGLAGSLRAFLEWQTLSFGQLNESLTLRIVIPAVLALVLGSQTILFSFFLSILGLEKRDL